jgi:hypothetical protein
MQSPVLNTGTGAILVWGPPNQPGTLFLNAAFPAGVLAVRHRTFGPAALRLAVDITINASDGTSELFTVNTVARPTPSFIGVTSDTPLTSVLFRTVCGTVRFGGRQLFVRTNLRDATDLPSAGTRVDQLTYRGSGDHAPTIAEDPIPSNQCIKRSESSLRVTRLDSGCLTHVRAWV